MSVIVKETCEAIWEVLHSDFVQAPSCEAGWKGLANSLSNIALVNCINNNLLDHVSPVS